MKKKRALKQGEAEKQRIQDFHDTVDAEETRRRRQGQRKQQQRHRSTRRNQSWGSEAEGWISTDHEDDLALQDLGFSAAELDRMRHEFEQSQRGHEVGYGDSVSYFQHFQQQQPASILQPPRQSGIPAFQQPTTQYAAPVSPAFDPIFGPSAYTLPSRAQPKMSSCFTDPQEDRPRKKRAKRVSFSESEDEAGKARKRGRTLEREERGDVKGVQGVQVRVRMMDGVEGRGRKRPRSQGSMGSVEF